mmetsp:Transcript_1503/g.1422  ORF Transcript_1503/g.1422 Transcript_1503/m.1422 type:complete len:314 (-) Transcript_1503:11-952(-)
MSVNTGRMQLERDRPRKRVRVQFVAAVDLCGFERARRMIFTVPHELQLVSDLDHCLRGRLVKLPLKPLHFAIDGFALPADERLGDILCDGDLLTVGEMQPEATGADATTPSSKQRPCLESSKQAAEKESIETPSRTPGGESINSCSPGTLAALDIALGGGASDAHLSDANPRAETSLAGSAGESPLVSSAAAAHAARAVLAAHRSRMSTLSGSKEHAAFEAAETCSTLDSAEIATIRSTKESASETADTVTTVTAEKCRKRSKRKRKPEAAAEAADDAAARAAALAAAKAEALALANAALARAAAQNAESSLE